MTSPTRRREGAASRAGAGTHKHSTRLDNVWFGPVRKVYDERRAQLLRSAAAKSAVCSVGQLFRSHNKSWYDGLSMDYWKAR